MYNQLTIDGVSNLPAGVEFSKKIDLAQNNSQQSGKPFFILVVEIANIEIFKKRRSQTVLINLYRELGAAIRKAVHPTQFVGRFQDGFGLVFDAVDVGQIDNIAGKLIVLVQNVIRAGHYNDLSGRWTDIIYQFLHPNNPGVIFPKVGWAIYPRDGQSGRDLVKRAQCHITELSR